MEEASPPDSTSATQLPVAVSQSLLPIKRTSSGRPTADRLTHRSITSPSASPSHPELEDTHKADEASPFPPLEKWYAIQSLKDHSNEEILRWLYYARCPDNGTPQPPYDNQITSPARSSPCSGRDLKSPFMSTQLARNRDSKASFSSAPSAGTRDSKSSFASFLSTRTPYSVRSSFTDYSFNENPPLPISKSASTYDEPPVNENGSRRPMKSPSLHKKLPLPPKYFCTSCDANGFGRKGDWKSHETEFHEHQEEYKCNFCDKVYHRKHRFIRHHTKAHCRDGCQHAETCRRELPKKRAWGCGFCVICLTDRSHRDEHIAGHYEDGKKKPDWNHSLVILGLLRQTYVAHAWLSLTHHRPSSSTYTWSEETAAELQAKLETEGQQTGYDLAREALDASLQSKSTLTEPNLGSNNMVWSEFPARTSSTAALQSSLASDNGTTAALFQTPAQYPVSKFNPRSDSLSNLIASNISLGLQPPAFDNIVEPFQQRNNQAPSVYPETDNAFTCGGIKFPRVPNETENVDPHHTFQPQETWYQQSSANIDLSTFTEDWGHPQ